MEKTKKMQSLHLFHFLSRKLNTQGGVCVVTIPLTWSIYITALLVDFAPKTLSFDCGNG